MQPTPSDHKSSTILEGFDSASTNNRKSEDNLDLLDSIEIILNRWKLIVKITSVAALISLAITLLLDNVYSATALVLPPQQDSSMLGMLIGSAGGNLSGLAGDLLGKGTTADMYVGILNSEAVNDHIIDRFKLMNEYDEEYRVTTYKVLKRKVDIAVGKKDGIISITVEDKDPKQAAAMANAYVEELGNIIVKLNITDSGNNKDFLGQRLAKAKQELIYAENGIKAFQAKNKVISVTDQAEATIVGIAQLRAQLSLQEVQLAALQRQFTDGSQEVKSVKSSISNLRTQIAKLEGSGTGSAIPNVGSVPELEQQYLRLMREFKLQETLVELLTKQYEIEKINSAKQISSLQIVQAARAPDKKSWPKRAFIVAAATTSAFFLSIIITLMAAAFESMQPDRLARWQRLIRFTKTNGVGK